VGVGETMICVAINFSGVLSGIDLQASISMKYSS
jgi:hypothetical protein